MKKKIKKKRKGKERKKRKNVNKVYRVPTAWTIAHSEAH